MFTLTWDDLRIDTTLFAQGELGRLAAIALSDIQARHSEDYERGLDPDGKPIKAGGYSAKYKERRLKFGLNTSPVNLRFTGEMLDSRQVLTRANGAIGRFVGTHAAAPQTKKQFERRKERAAKRREKSGSQPKQRKPRTPRTGLKTSKRRGSRRGNTNAAIASQLVDRGFGLHFFGLKDQLIAEQQFLKVIDSKLEQNFTVKNNT